MRMVTFRTHTRGDVLLKPGVEFDATEQEAHAYAARLYPLAGPLDDDEPVAAKPAPKAKPKKATQPGVTIKRGAKK